MPASHTRATVPAREPAFVSRQVSEARRYYLDLQPSKSAGLVVVCGGVERTLPDYIVQRRDFPFLCVELVMDGAGSLVLRGRRFPLRPGVAFAYAPGVAHVIRSDPKRPLRKYYVDFAGTEAKRLLSATPLGRWQAVELAAPQEIAAFFDALQQEAMAGTALAKETCAAWLRLMLLKLRGGALPAGRAAPRSLATFEKVRRHVEQNFLRLQTVEEIARECHITPMYAARLFRRFAQSGAYQFLIRLKMNRAAELLLDRGLLVKEAADELGFPDAFHFSRLFKRVHGLSPTQFVGRQR